MKKISLIIVGALFMAGNVFATEPIDNPSKELKNQIQEVLYSHSMDLNEELTGNVRFTFNQKGEMVILSIETQSQDLAHFVKGRLNYKKMNIGDVKEGKVYVVPVRITS